VVTTPPPPHYFASVADFRRRLETHHDAHRELVVGFHKVGTGTPSMTWTESVREALCFGWTDGVRRRVTSALGVPYMIRDHRQPHHVRHP
jgi:uncharacterized protein YdeI (YjbR/CyaY-like superfamily)